MVSHSDHTAYVASLSDDKFDPELGADVRDHLWERGLLPDPPATLNKDGVRYDPEQAVQSLIGGIKQGMLNLGLDMANDPSLKDTPKRYAKMLVGELTKGLNFDFFPKCTTFPNGTEHEKTLVSDREYEMDEKAGRVTGGVGKGVGGWSYRYRVGATDEMVFLGQIQTLSLCEHHLQTIDGFTYIGYLPDREQIGLSKLARVTDFFARRPQVQERMTEQIYAALAFVLKTPDIAVVQRCAHYCMRARGSLQHASVMQTNKMGGRFLEKPALRQEFLDACRG